MIHFSKLSDIWGVWKHICHVFPIPHPFPSFAAVSTALFWDWQKCLNRHSSSASLASVPSSFGPDDEGTSHGADTGQKTQGWCFGLVSLHVLLFKTLKNHFVYLKAELERERIERGLCLFTSWIAVNSHCWARSNLETRSIFRISHVSARTHDRFIRKVWMRSGAAEPCMGCWHCRLNLPCHNASPKLPAPFWSGMNAEWFENSSIYGTAVMTTKDMFQGLKWGRMDTTGEC